LLTYERKQPSAVFIDRHVLPNSGKDECSPSKYRCDNGNLVDLGEHTVTQELKTTEVAPRRSKSRCHFTTYAHATGIVKLNFIEDNDSTCARCCIGIIVALLTMKNPGPRQRSEVKSTTLTTSYIVIIHDKILPEIWRCPK
jgi:hypothetical protein